MEADLPGTAEMSKQYDKMYIVVYVDSTCYIVLLVMMKKSHVSNQ